MEIETWADLAAKIESMSDEQKTQPIQCVKPTAIEDDVQEMLPGIALGTVEELGFYKCRSTHSNEYEALDVVLLLDGNRFSETGAELYELGDDDEFHPIYGADGPTNPSKQKSPQAIADSTPTDDLPRHAMEAVRYRAGRAI